MKSLLPAVFLLLAPFPAAHSADGGPDLHDCRIHAGPGYPGIKARCGTLERPLNPADDDSPRIELGVAVVAALSLEPRTDPFVPVAGGPGQSSIEFYAAQAQAFEAIRRTRDIVLLDQRGTGRSAALECPVDESMLAGEYSAEETLAATRECLAGLPHDPRYFTTSIAVSDLEALRHALGYARFNLYGVSYGSRVVQHFARRYPDAVRTLILDGVVPPQAALGPDIALEAERALDTIFDRCAASAPCGERFPDLRGDFAQLVSRLADGKLQVDLQNPVAATPERLMFGSAELAVAVRLLSYQPTGSALLPLLVHEAAHGNLAPLAAQYLNSAEAMAGALAIGMHNSVVCTEDLPYADMNPERLAALEQTYIGPVMLEALQTVCSAWPRGILDADFRKPLQTETPVLLLSGEADPVTPPAYAERAAVDLANAAHLIGRAQGHGLAPRGCVPDILAQFVAQAAVDTLETGCLERLFAMPFFLNFLGPAP